VKYWKELNDAKGRFKLSKKDVKDAKQKLNLALYSTPQTLDENNDLLS
jgi:hypothetical protein